MNFSNLLTAHNIFVFIVLVVLSAGWLLGHVDTAIAIPLLTTIGGLGIGSSITLNGISAGVPLTTQTTQTPAPAPTSAPPAQVG